MALNLETTYAGRVTPSSAAYPFGEPRNETSSGANNGTPLERQWVKDIYGLLQAMLDGGQVTPSGVPDNAVNSDYLQALKVLSFDRVRIQGLAVQWVNTGGGLLVESGRCRNWSNSRTLTHDPVSPLTKQITSTWSEGPGGLLSPAEVSDGGWQDVYLIAKPDGTTDLICEPDNSGAAPKFWLEPELAAAGFTDDTLYRRVGYAWSDGGGPSFMPEWIHAGFGRVYWATSFADLDNAVTLANSGPRDEIGLTHVPANTLAIVSMHALLSAPGEILLTTTDQDDIAPDEDNFSMRSDAAATSLTWTGDLQMTSIAHPGTFFARRDGTGGTTISKWSVIVHGYIDAREDVAGVADDLSFP